MLSPVTCGSRGWALAQRIASLPLRLRSSAKSAASSTTASARSKASLRGTARPSIASCRPYPPNSGRESGTRRNPARVRPSLRHDKPPADVDPHSPFPWPCLPQSVRTACGSTSGRRACATAGNGRSGYWFHGGGYAAGSANSPLSDGVRLCHRGNVAVVAVNHRLNAFGYLYLAELGGAEFRDSGNVGQARPSPGARNGCATTSPNSAATRIAS